VKGKLGADLGSLLLLVATRPKGGGIIDMMNRRLRERLTEEEILQVFVDVCEVSRSESLEMKKGGRRAE